MSLAAAAAEAPSAVSSVENEDVTMKSAGAVLSSGAALKGTNNNTKVNEVQQRDSEQSVKKRRKSGAMRKKLKRAKACAAGTHSVGSNRGVPAEASKVSGGNVTSASKDVGVHQGGWKGAWQGVGVTLQGGV